MLYMNLNVLMAVSLAMGSSAAWADAPRHRAAETSRATVSVSDLDLATAAGKEAARRRIAARAWQLCLRFESALYVDARENTYACYQEAVATALKSIEELRR